MASYKPIIIVALLALGTGLAVSACSSTTAEGPGPEDPTGDPVGGGLGDEPTDPVFQDDPEPEPDPEPRGATGSPGRLRVKIMASGTPGSGQVRILTASSEREVIGEGPSSRTFDIPSGQYDLEVRLDDALDRPEKTFRGVRVAPGDTTVHEVNFVVGHVKLQPMRGRSKAGKQIRWRYNGGGDWFEQTSVAGEEVVLSAGRYDAEVNVARRAITIEDIQVYEGRRTISPQIHMR